ncbi:MAG: hypothetical protein E6G94_13015 [Alphaproteobacteria bacterium]|nr:MAG: hypothetical protein E6G94_13015 [Alphaproteobacteria bacterium]
MAFLQIGAAMLLAVAVQSAPQSRPAPARTAPARSAPQQAQPAPARPQGPVIPTRVTARVLVGLCGSDKGACLAYVLGAADAYTSALTAAGRPQIFCFPAGTANQAIADSAVQFLRARPQEGGSNAGLALLGAFTTIYPCPR